MGYFAASSIALSLVVLTVTLHYEVLRTVAGLIPQLSVPPRPRILVVLAAAFLGHVLQIAIYGLAYWGMTRGLGIGRLTGEVEGGALDYFYFSAATFTTLGVGDLVPEGPLRIVAGIESLNGLVLITWSASFTYLAMEKFWEDHR